MTASAASFQRFLGFDVGKHSVTVYDSGTGVIRELANRPDSLHRFLADGRFGTDVLAICEATGGYERPLLAELVAAGIPAHRADTPRVKAFIRSLGIRAKTDPIDARALARYGEERAQTLSPWSVPQEELLHLQALVQRRADLIAMRVAETNRSKGPTAAATAQSFKAILDAIEAQLNAIEEQIDSLIDASQTLGKTVRCLETIDGIGHITAIALAAAMPELGQLTGKQAASLAGLAPHARDSGTFSGRRRVYGGRRQVPKLVFMAALAACRMKGAIGDWYQSLINRGKCKMVAITAVMRKLVVIANARIRDMNQANAAKQS